MKVLLINGSPHQQGCTYTALREVADTLEKNGMETEFHWIGTQPVAGCVACGQCAQTGRCVFDDQVNRLAELIDSCDGIVVGSPVYFAGPTGPLCAILDRLFYMAGSRRMAGKAAAAVVSCRRGGASAAFDRLNRYFVISNMPVVPSQYWNQVHGSKPEDVLQDEEGLQTMRTLGQNMAWMLKSRQAGEAQGISAPAYEPKLRTSFIR